MRKSTVVIALTFLSISLMAAGPVLAQEPGKRLTQEEFAVDLVRAMKLEGSLPIAVLASDCVNLLERIGIAPLSGWDNKALLTHEDYLVIMAKAHGKESMLHQRAVAVEEKNIEIINTKWQESYDRLGRWMPLSELLSDKDYFPEGALRSPYGLKYEDRNSDHKVDPHFLPVVSLMRLRESLSSQ